MFGFSLSVYMHRRESSLSYGNSTVVFLNNPSAWLSRGWTIWLPARNIRGLQCLQTPVHSGHCLCFSYRRFSRYEAIHVHALFTPSRQVWPYLCVGRWQSSPDVDTKEGILPQGDVELQELGLTDVDLWPPKHPWRDFLCHPSTNFGFATVYTAVFQWPGH